MNGQYAIGTPATEAQIAGWNIDVRPDGVGLPAGSGSVADGEMLYEDKCASCHGVFGEGTGRWPILAGGEGTLTDDRPEKTIGSYWPFVSTLWDYIHRAMPFLEPQSLADDEVYAVTAYILYLNDLVTDDFILSNENLADIRLPNEAAFADDPRPDVNNARCMQDCRDPKTINITWDSTNLGVTPVGHLEDNRLEESDELQSQRAVNESGEKVYQKVCAICHDYGVAGAPIKGEVTEWRDRLKQSLDVLYHHAIEGYMGQSGYMPPKGGNLTLSDIEVKAAVRYMTGGLD